MKKHIYQKHSSKTSIKQILIYIVFLFIILIVLSHTAAGVYYNAANITSANNPYSQALALNDVVGGFIGYGILIIAFVITFTILNLRTASPGASLGGASFFTALSASILLPLNLISLWIYQITILVMGVGILLSLWVSKQ